MTPNAPGVPFALDERGGGVEGLRSCQQRPLSHAYEKVSRTQGRKGGGETHISTLRAEEMPNMPFRPARHDDLALDRRLAASAARGEGFVEVEVAIEPRRGVCVCRVRVWFGIREEALLAVCGRLRVEGDALERRGTVVAGEAFRVEAGAGGRDEAAGDGEGALGAEGWIVGGCGGGGGMVVAWEGSWLEGRSWEGSGAVVGLVRGVCVGDGVGCLIDHDGGRGCGAVEPRVGS